VAAEAGTIVHASPSKTPSVLYGSLHNRLKGYMSMRFGTHHADHARVQTPTVSLGRDAERVTSGKLPSCLDLPHGLAPFGCGSRSQICAGARCIQDPNRSMDLGSVGMLRAKPLLEDGERLLKIGPRVRIFSLRMQQFP
jgi:hypothetical protein